MQLIMIRHGLPVRTSRSAGGPPDPPLSERGQRQAEALGAWLADEPIDVLVTSPLLRARQTAEPLAERLGLPVEVVDDLAENDKDAPEYIPMEDLKREDPEAYRSFVTGGPYSQDLTQFQSRVVTATEDVIARYAKARVAAFCHAGVINVWACHVLGTKPSLFYHPAYTSVNRFLASRAGNRGIGTLNETPHLNEIDPDYTLTR